MSIIINLFLSIIFTSIDFYNIKFYFDYMNIDIFSSDIFLYLGDFFLLLSNWDIPKNYILNILFFIIGLIFIFSIVTPKTTKYRYLLLLSTIKIIIYFFTLFLLEIVYNSAFYLNQINKFYFQQLFYIFLNKYFFFLILFIIINRKVHISNYHFHIFKIISMIMSALFCANIIIYNDKLFYFKNIGRIFILVVIIYNTMLLFFDRYQTKHEAIEQEMEMINQAVKSEKEYIIKKNEADDTVRDMRHDLKNNFTIINGYLNDGKIQDAQEYIEKIVGKINEASSIIHSGYSSLDSIINDKISLMKEKNISYEEMIAPINIGNIEIEDLSLLIGIALDNAIEAAEKVEGLREIKLKIKNHKNLLMINIQNSVKEGKRIIFGRTSKLDKKNHGFGVNKIKYFAKLYHGEANYSNEDNKVILRIFLNTETD